MSHDHEGGGELEDTDSYDLTQVPTEESGLDPTTPATPAIEERPQTQWKPSSRTVDETLTEGLSNEDLWMLIRRFNKVGKLGALGGVS